MTNHGSSLAVAVRSVEWALSDLAFKLPRSEVTPEECRHLAIGLDDLALALRLYASEYDGEGVITVEHRASYHDQGEAPSQATSTGTRSD